MTICTECGVDDDCRPYGENGAMICFDCGMKEEYDVVLDVLQKHHDKLWEMTRRNMQSEYIGMNIMDDIRLEQMDQLKQAMKLWRERNDTV